MTVLGVGVDIVSIERIAGLHMRYGARFAARILAPAERAQLPTGAAAAAFLAKRFAAKEAMAKALGTGFREGLRLADIEVTHNDKGRPGLRLHGAAAALAAALGVRQMHLSLADERRYAIAHVLLLGEEA